MDRSHPDEPTRRRRWPLVLASLLLLAGGGIFTWVMVAGSAYRKAIAFADERDPGWRIAEIEARRATYPDEQNGAVKVVLVQSMLPQGFPDVKKDELLTDLGSEQLMNDQQSAAVRAMLQAAGPALAEARTMIDRPHGRHAFNYTPDFVSTIVNCQSNREALNVLRYDALDLAQREDADGALAACHAMLNCGTSIGDEPMSISMLVRIGCQAVATNSLERVLAQGAPSDKGLAALQAAVEATEKDRLLLYGLRGERAGQFHMVENMRNGTAKLGGPGGGALLSAVVSMPGIMTHQVTGCLDYTNRLVELAKTEPETWEVPLKELDAKAAQLPMLAKLLAPALTKVGDACIRNHAQLRCTAVAIAAERFRRKEGHWPGSLDELVKAGFLTAVPVDPYDAKPLRVKRTDDGLRVYTTGPDRVDDGGKIDRARPLTAGTDLGFRLWDLTKRRQPAPPPKPAEPTDDSVPGDPARAKP